MSQTCVRRALAVVVVLLVAGVGPVASHPSPAGHDGGAAAGAAVVDHGRLDVAAAEAEASFRDTDLTVTQGDEVTFTVYHSDPATVIIGGDEYGFNVTVALSGSGTTDVTIDTRATTNDDPNAFIEGGDATMHSDPLDEPVKPWEYLLRAEIGGVERDVTTLTVAERAPLTAELYRAPSSFTPAEYQGEGEDGDANVGPLKDVMTAGTNVTRTDYAVARINESGLETALNPADMTGSDAANGLEISVVQAEAHANEAVNEYTATDSDAVSVLPNFADDEIYVLWDSSGVEIADRAARNSYDVAVTLTAASSFVDEETTLVTTSFAVREASMSLTPVNDTVHYPWDAESFRVTGQTNRVPNTELEVRLRSTEPEAFLEMSEAPVGANGSFTTALDLEGVPRDRNATLWVQNYSAATSQTVRLVGPHPSVTVPNQTVATTSVDVSHVEVPTGGFVRLQNSENTTVGRSDYLAPGRHANVTVAVNTSWIHAQPVRAELVHATGDQAYDPNASRYLANGHAVNDTAHLTTDAPPATTATTTATQPPPTTQSNTLPDVVTHTPLAPSDDDATNSGVPLSPIGTLVAVICASGLLLWRTR